MPSVTIKPDKTTVVERKKKAQTISLHFRQIELFQGEAQKQGS